MTNLIVISSERDLPDESRKVNDLFLAGLELFHLRKPEWNATQQSAFLQQIDPAFLNRISVHQHLDQLNEFGLQYAHLTEANRKNGTSIQAKHLSTSFHELTDVMNEGGRFSYCFLSPVFDSISKSGYKGKFDANSIALPETTRIFALGGIDANNAQMALDMGFYGVAVLGAVWEKGEAITNFLKIKDACRKHVHTL